LRVSMRARMPLAAEIVKESMRSSYRGMRVQAGCRRAGKKKALENQRTLADM
jgi:hypothetical protein